MAEAAVLKSAEAAKEAGQRWLAINKSNTSHCCFEGSVIDVNKPFFYGGSTTKVLGYETYCETFDFEAAERIAELLNASEPSTPTQS